jgi:PAS domain S-box-containing protein
VRKLNQFLDSVIDNANVWLNVLDENANVLMWNRAAEEISGYSREEVVGHDKIWEWLYPEEEYRNQILGEAVAIMKGAEGIEELGVETIIQRRDGRARVILWNSRNLVDEEGNSMGSIAIGLDITERKRAEEEVRRLNQFLDSVIDNANVWLDVLDEKANVLIWNRAAEEISGYSREEVVGHDKIWEWLYPDEEYRNQIFEEAMTIIEGVEESDDATTIRCKDGRARVISWNSRNLVDENGDPMGSIAIGLDITERKQAEEALRRYSEQLEEMVEGRTQELRDAQEQLMRRERLAALGHLAGSVGHDLRNPLGAITNAAYFLNMVLENPQPDVKETLDILKREAATAENIISDLLEFARTRPPTREEADLNEIIQYVLSRVTIPENVQVITKLDGTLAPFPVDPDQLVRAFDNIIRNGLQAMPEGGQLSIESKYTDRQWVAISFTDTGVGISEENRAKLFEPLFTTKAKGVGLGLSIVKRLVEGHDGTVDVKSELGKGSTFTVRLPVDV